MAFLEITVTNKKLGSRKKAQLPHHSVKKQCEKILQPGGPGPVGAGLRQVYCVPNDRLQPALHTVTTVTAF